MRAVNRKEPTEKESAENARGLYKTAAVELSLHEGPEIFQTVDDIGNDMPHGPSTGGHVFAEGLEDQPQPGVNASGSEVADHDRGATNAGTGEYPEGTQAIIGD